MRRCTRRRIRAYVQLCFLGLLLILVATFSNGMRSGLGYATRPRVERSVRQTNCGSGVGSDALRSAWKEAAWRTQS